MNLRLALVVRLGWGVLGLSLIISGVDKGVGCVLLNLLMFDLSLILAIIPHELGHAFIAKSLGWRVFKIVIGSGKILFKTRFLGIDAEFRSFPFWGYVRANPKEERNFHAKRFIFALAGPVANMLLATIAFLVMSGHLNAPNHFVKHLLPLQIFFIANVFLALSNLFPLVHNTSLGPMPSDGLQMWRAMKRNRRELDAYHAGWFYNEGIHCMEGKKYKEAKDWLEKGLTIHPDNIGLLMTLGINAIRLQQFKAAREHSLRAKKLAEGKPVVEQLILNNIAYANALSGTTELLEEADQYSQEAMQHLGWMASVQGTRGAVLLELGQIDEAMPLLSAPLDPEESPTNKAESACWLAIAEARRNNPRAAKLYLEEAMKQDSECFMLDRVRAIMQGVEMPKHG